MAIQIFDNECVESHPIYEKAGALLSDVCKRDYKDNFFDERIECLDMDTYEVMICGGQKQATMDAVIGIADYENNHKTNCKLLMVELRLGYKSTQGLEAASLNREPTLKSKACFKYLYFTKIISALCCYLEYFSYLYTINSKNDYV